MTKQANYTVSTRDLLDLVDEEEAIAILGDMIRIRSIFDPDREDGNERAMADHVCRLLDGWGIAYSRWDVAPNRPNIVADIRGGAGPTLVFEGHMDVVTAGDDDDWDHEPFGAEIVGGKMFGRGTADMKSGLTSMLVAAKTLHLSGAEFPGTVRLAILSDEEGMMQGARSFAEKGYLNDAGAAIICEPEGRRVCIAQKGAMRFTVTFAGRMAHGCMPDEAANPLIALAECVVGLRGLEAEILSEQETHSLLGRFSLSPTVVAGGEIEQANVIPGSATLMLDVRTTPGDDHEAIVSRIREVCGQAAAGIKGVECDVVLIDDRPATETDPDAPIVHAAVAAHQETFGENPEIGGVPGSTDGTIFWMHRRIPLVTWGPGDTTIPHQANEFVRLDELALYGRAYIQAALRYFGDAGSAG